VGSIVVATCLALVVASYGGGELTSPSTPGGPDGPTVRSKDAHRRQALREPDPSRPQRYETIRPDDGSHLHLATPTASITYLPKR
jgi:hypothetical protein